MHILYRTCAAVSTKPRPEWFSKHGCFVNLLQQFRHHSLHCVIDGETPDWMKKPLVFHTEQTWTSMTGQIVAVKNINEQHNARAFLKALDYACTLEGYLYLVEDDFVHRPGAPQILEGGLRRFDYVTGYDHPDKYGHLGNPTDVLGAPVTIGEHCHYKYTCSTVMTFAVKADTLREDADVWRKWSQDKHGWTRDHKAFCELRSRGRTVGSSIPAYATHCEPQWLAPLVDWEAVIRA